MSDAIDVEPIRRHGDPGSWLDADWERVRVQELHRSHEELIELALPLQRPEKTLRTSSKPPATDRKERRKQCKPGGAKSGEQGHSPVMSEDTDAVVDHRPDRCSCCGGDLHTELSAEASGLSLRSNCRRWQRCSTTVSPSATATAACLNPMRSASTRPPTFGAGPALRISSLAAALTK